MIRAWRLSTSLCVNIFTLLFASLTITLLATTFMTVPFLTSVTVTGCTVLMVVIVAVPFMPGFRSWTDSCLPFTSNLKSSGIVYSFVPAAVRATT